MSHSFISIRVDSDTKHQLRQACEEKDIKVSGLARRLLKSWLNKQQTNQPVIGDNDE